MGWDFNSLTPSLFYFVTFVVAIMGKTLYTYQFKLKLNKGQKCKVDSWISVCRLVWNLALEARENAYKCHKKRITEYQLYTQLTDLRSEYKFIDNVPTKVLRPVIKRQTLAYTNFFKGGNLPRFAKKSNYGSISFLAPIRVIGDKINISRELGLIKFIRHRDIDGNIKSATIIKKASGYYINLLVKRELNPQPHPNHDSQVGIDMGVAFFASLSNGEQIDNPRHTDRYKRELRVAQRSLSRKVKGSRNYHTQLKKVNLIHEKISRTRADFLHKQSKIITSRYQTIAIEDLRVSSMVKCKGIGKSIKDAGWGKFRTMLQYKSLQDGCKLIAIDPRYTSQTCNHCGEVDKKSRISQSKFVCTECGAEDNADINAAKNILDRALSNYR